MTPILELRGIGKRFGAFRALDGIDLVVRPGETLGLIGPNGAGKTTLFNVVTGFLPPDQGSVHFGGRALHRMTPARRVRLGLVRTFQKAMVFPALSLHESIALAARQSAGIGLRWFGAARARAAAAARADALIAGAGLERHRNRPVGTLAYGEQRMADVLLSLALQPRLLLLDEPTAGLAAAEAEQLLDTVARHAPDAATVLIAHDIDVVFARSDRIAVLDYGRLLCCDTPHAVRTDPAVLAAYLGAA